MAGHFGNFVLQYHGLGNLNQSIARLTAEFVGTAQ
jgi:hypothetical protein